MKIDTIGHQSTLSPPPSMLPEECLELNLHNDPDSMRLLIAERNSTWLFIERPDIDEAEAPGARLFAAIRAKSMLATVWKYGHPCLPYLLRILMSCIFLPSCGGSGDDASSIVNMSFDAVVPSEYREDGTMNAVHEQTAPPKERSQ